jgi:hypothetical protein
MFYQQNKGKTMSNPSTSKESAPKNGQAIKVLVV